MRWALFVFYRIRSAVHTVEHGSKSALFSCGIVLVKNTVSNCLVDLLDSLLVGLLGGSFVACCHSGFIFFEIGLESGFEHLVLKRLRLDDLNALFR